MEVSEIDKRAIYPSIYSCIILFCIAALFEAAFLSLTIQAWNAQSILVYLGLVFTLQLAACLKAVCVWRVHRYCIGYTSYIFCAIAMGLSMYILLEAFGVLVAVFAVTAALPLNYAAIALFDAILSTILLYFFKSWWRLILVSDLPRLAQQIRHHFLFNTLNTTVCRINENPRLAQDNLERLADLFRKILFLKIYIDLEEELASVKCYLGIEQYRLGKRLQVRWMLNYKTHVMIKVPSLILQPLVENAIYHGIEKIVGGGTIEIRLYTDEDRLIMQVCNPISPIEHSNLQPRNAIAQTNIERRLALAYGDDFNFKREQCETEYRVTINIPLLGGLL